VNACSRIDPEQARQVIDAILSEDGERLLELGISWFDRCLDNGNVAVAKTLFTEQADGTFEFSGLGQALVEWNAFSTLWKAVDVILADLRNQATAPQAGTETNNAKVN
jgi:hypothetical protein